MEDLKKILSNHALNTVEKEQVLEYVRGIIQTHSYKETIQIIMDDMNLSDISHIVKFSFYPMDRVVDMRHQADFVLYKHCVGQIISMLTGETVHNVINTMSDWRNNIDKEIWKVAKKNEDKRVEQLRNMLRYDHKDVTIDDIRDTVVSDYCIDYDTAFWRLIDEYFADTKADLAVTEESDSYREAVEMTVSLLTGDTTDKISDTLDKWEKELTV